MTPAEINEIANWIALAAIIPFALFTVIYGFGSPWYKSPLGVTIFGLGAGVTGVLCVVLARRWFKEYPGYEWVAIIAYSLFTLIGIALLVILLLERRRSDMMQFPVKKKEKSK